MTWTSDEMTRLATAEELQIAARRDDGTLRDPVTIWVVRYGGDVYVRSVTGPTASWFRGARDRHEARVHAGGVEKEVALFDADHRLDDQIDEAYRAKYHRYAPSIISAITSPDARATTLRLVPAKPAATDPGETL